MSRPLRCTSVRSRCVVQTTSPFVVQLTNPAPNGAGFLC
nr:MAG TPA: hypothetical protein [Caudoviricetes sp.]